MPRRHRSRQSVPQLPPIIAARSCIGCDEHVSATRRACPECWRRLPARFQARLKVPAGADPHTWDGPGYQDAVAQARDWLGRHQR